MIRGFTGTRQGWTDAQRVAFIGLLSDVKILHHGDCVGSDAQAHAVCIEHGVLVHVHPAIDDRYRAYCTGYTWIEQPLEYLARNRNIVHKSNGLIAVSRTTHEVGRSGTWMTVRYARRINVGLPVKHPIVIIYPDGSVRGSF